MINFDMVGVGDGSRCGYSAAHTDLKDLVEKVDGQIQTVRSTFPIRELGVRGSDHAPFHARGIPVLYFASNGPHLKYHTTGDTIYRVNPHVMQDIARIGYLLTIELATK
jgi:Zn-dependent M28 family amino/carboxypeptidase